MLSLVAAGQLISLQEFVDLLIIIGHKALIFSLVVIAGWVIGRLVGALTGRIVMRAGVDPVMRKTAIGRSVIRSGLTTADFFKAIAKWSIYAVSVLLAFKAIDVPSIEGPVDGVLAFLPNLIGGIIMLVAGAIIADVVGELIKKGASPEHREAFYLDLIANLVKIILYFMVITIVMSQIGMDVTILYTVAQAFAWGAAIFMGVTVGIIVGWFLKDKLKEIFPG
jgi:hypothetical protein